VKSHLKKLLAAALAASLCLLTACVGAPDNREDPLAGHNANALLPFHTRVPDAAVTATPTPAPTSTSIVTLPQDWQNVYVPGVSMPTTAPTINRPSHSFVRLEQGDVSEDVRLLQERLIELGYLSGTADGQFGANTKLAVKRFQKALGLSQTGVATVSLQEKLFMSSAPVYIPTTVTPAPTQAVGSNTAGYEALVRGDRGEAVANLQRRLIALGYLSGTADGVFGANTETAIKVFQSQLGLSQTGVASASLQIKLFSANAPYAPVATRVPTVPPTATPTPTINVYEPLEPGDTGEAVVRMQNRLKQLGYFSGSATGNYYRETTAAVQLFQAALGLNQTGIASSSLLMKLYSSSAPYYSGPTPVPTERPVTYTTLRYGDRGTEVLNLQKRLIALGYMTTSADGQFGGNTRDAVKLFQKTIGFTENGVADATLQTLLFSENAPVYVPTTTVAPTRVPAAPTSRYQQLQPGDTGEAVKALQSRLKELGFFSGQIKGNYLTKTTDSVRLFQAAINHARTGIATPEMQEILFSDSAPDYFSVESDYVTLEKLDSGVQVLFLQQRLKELGWLTGTVDGDYGSQTVNAVSAFQRHVGLPETGTATPATQTILFGSGAPYAPVPTNAPTPTNVPAPAATPTLVPVPTQSGYSTLSNGSTGDEVKALQRRLKELGYFEENIGGNYLINTETAVQLFQAQMGYTPDGVATPDLQKLIFSSSAPFYNGSAYVTLSKGVSGPAVRNLQSQLIRLGYLSGTADGDFGSGTEKALKLFQQATGFTADGIASPELQRILFNTTEPYRPAETPVPTAAPTKVPATQTPSSATQYRELKGGVSGEDVKALQMRLTELGFYNGLHKGNYKSITELAFRLFQAQHGYPITGIATPEQQALLFSSSAQHYTGTVYIDLTVSDEGVPVVALQQRLIELGYLSGKADGEYGDGTKSAVRKFQRAISYRTTDGNASAELQALLFAPSAPAYGSSSEGSSNEGSSNEGSSNEGSSGSDSASTGSYSSYRTIKNGNTGEDVKAIQRRLKELGYFSGEIGGNYLTKTQAAVRLFQEAIGYDVTGEATPLLQMRLFSSSAPAYTIASAPDRYEVLSRGDSGSAVKLMQKRLAQLGWLDGSADGDFGRTTEKALSDFQYCVGLDADGIASIETQERLFSASAPRCIRYTDLQPGAKGDAVLSIQIRMIELGYLDAKDANLDGIYGNGLKNALIKLQVTSGVDPQQADGIATAELQAFLFSANAELYSNR